MRWTVLVIVAACSSASKPRPPLAHRDAPACAPADAIAGRGQPRDYQRATTCYARACADGCGDYEACVGYLDLTNRDRGEVFGFTHIAIAARMCDRGYLPSCLVAAFASVRRPDVFDQASDIGVRCDAGDLAACEIAVRLDLGMGDSESVEELRHQRFERMCAGGSLAGCMLRLNKAGVRPCEGADAAACRAAAPRVLEEVRAEHAWAENAVARVTVACDNGDADACAVLPGRAIPDASLCAAHDFQACDRLAKDGDAQARRHACEVGLTSWCDPPVDRATTLFPTFAVECLEHDSPVEREECRSETYAKRVPRCGEGDPVPPHQPAQSR